MPSLPTKNSAPECSSDAYRRYLPPSYRYSFELYIPNSFTTLFITYLKFLIYCTVCVMAIFSTNFILKYIENNIGDKKKYRSEGLTFLHDLYWFILLSLYCFCFTFICYRQIPREHIHVRFIMNCFTNYWCISLYLTSLFISLIAFTIHYSLKVLEWNQHALSPKHNLDSFLSHWNIFCNIFICDDWTLSRVVTYTLIPPFTLFFNCFLIHYWLFGFHKDGYYRRYKIQQQQTQNNRFMANQALLANRQQKMNKKYAFHNSLSALSNKESKSHNISKIDEYDDIDDHGNDDKEEQDDHDDDDEILDIFDNDNKINISSSSISAINKSMSPMFGMQASKYCNTSSALSGSSHSSPLNMNNLRGIFNKSFIAFRYPESKMLRWIVFYCLIFLIVNAIFNALSNVKKQWYNEYFVQIFIFILATTSILKWIMKRIARMIDASRGTSPVTKSIHSRSTHDPLSSHITEYLRGKSIPTTTYVSLELCTELYMDFVFFLAYRELMMYYIPKLDEFFKISIYFFINEVWLCSIRPSSLYYLVSGVVVRLKFMQRIISFLLCNKLRDGKYHNYDDERSDLSGISSDNEYRSVDPSYLKKRLLFFNWRDDCTLLQWQIRCSLDISFRILSGIICCAVIITQVLILGAKHFDLNKADWIKGMQYIALSGAIQLVYFLIVYIWNFKVQNFPLLEPWVSLQINNPATWNYVCVVSIAIAFWLPDL